MQHTVGRSGFGEANISEPNVGIEQDGKDFNFVADEIPKLPPKWLWTEGCRSVVTRHEYYSEKGTDNQNLVPTNDPDGELEDNEWFNFKGIPHHAFALASQREYLNKGGCRYDIDNSEWGEDTLNDVTLPSIQELFKVSARRHILINHSNNDKGSIIHPQILVSYWDIQEFRALGYKIDNKQLFRSDKWNSQDDADFIKTQLDAGVPIDHFDRAKWMAENYGEGHNGYYSPEFVLTFSFPRGGSDEPKKLYNTSCLAITSNKGLQDFLTACDTSFFDSTANLNMDASWRKIGSGKSDWHYTADCRTVNVPSLHMAINEALWVLGYSIRREVREVSKPQLFSKINKSKDLIDLFSPDGKKQFGAAVMVLPKVSYIGGDHHADKHTGIQVKPHNRMGHYRNHPTAGKVWVRSCEVKGGAESIGEESNIARVKRNDKAV